MDGEALTNRPESPKKKIKASPVTHSEAEPSNYCDCNSNVDSNKAHGHGLSINGFGCMVAPSRRERISTIPDSSSEASSCEITENCTARVQEEEVSSSENSIGSAKGSEDVAAVCDSASLDSTSDSNDKH